MTEDALVDLEATKFLRGDNRLVGEVRAAIRYVVRGFRLHSATAEELTQESMTRIVGNLQAGRFRGESSLRTYASNVAKYTCLEHLRRRRNEIELDEASEGSARSTQLGPEEALLRTEEHLKNLRRFLALPREGQDMLRLIFVEGLTYRQVADRLGISEGAVKLRVYRCRLTGRQLRRRGADTGGEPGKLFRFRHDDKETDR